MRIPVLLLLGAVLCCWSCKKDTETTATPQLTGILKTLRTEHPRLILTDQRLNELKEARKTDATLDKYIVDVQNRAKDNLVKPKLERVLIGPRLLSVSRDLLDRVYTLALAYRFTNNKAYLDGAVNNLKTVCAFSDWNPSHFLDVAEMMHGVAIGYDWLYKDLSAGDRETIRLALREKGLIAFRNAYQGAFWRQGDNNWNQVCHGGMIVASLALAETDPFYAQEYIPQAVSNLPYAMKQYAPEGVWYEGPAYWSYATEYVAYGLAALQTALGSMQDLEKSTGLNVTADMPINTAGPTNLLFNFADAGDNSKADASPALLFLAQTFKKQVYANYTHQLLKSLNARAEPLHVVWYMPETNEAANRPLDAFMKGGIADLVTFRSSWTDPNALWLAVKGGDNNSNHAHLDLGSFELDAFNIRWIRDLGSDDYNLPGYFTMGATGQRWTYYRLNSLSHNVPILGNSMQYPLAKAKVTASTLNTATPSATLDLTEAYKDFSSRTTRTISMVDNRTAFLMTDTHTLTKTTEVAWGVTTAMNLTVQKGGKAIFTHPSSSVTRSLTAEIMQPAGAEFVIESAERTAPEKTNAGNRRLLVRLPNQTGQVTISIKLTPK